MVCKYCDAKLTEDDMFCPECGKKTDVLSVIKVFEANNYLRKKVNYGKDNFIKYIILMSLLFIAYLLIIVISFIELMPPIFILLIFITPLILCIWLSISLYKDVKKTNHLEYFLTDGNEFYQVLSGDYKDFIDCIEDVKKGLEPNLKNGDLIMVDYYKNHNYNVKINEFVKETYKLYKRNEKITILKFVKLNKVNTLYELSDFYEADCIFGKKQIILDINKVGNYKGIIAGLQKNVTKKPNKKEQ